MEWSRARSAAALAGILALIATEGQAQVTEIRHERVIHRRAASGTLDELYRLPRAAREAALTRHENVLDHSRHRDTGDFLAGRQTEPMAAEIWPESRPRVLSWADGELPPLDLHYETATPVGDDD